MRLYKIFTIPIILIFKLISGKPIVFPEFGSMTLDVDDIKIAKQYLKEYSQWEDINVIQKFESEFSKWNNSKYSYSFIAGRVALSACLYALNLKKGDEVLLPGYTCVVVPNAINFAGLIPIYIDIELDTYGLDIHQLKKQITPKTKAILLHHLYGLVCRDYEEILSFAKNNNLKVIEDCAHSTGAIFKGKKVGTRGDVGFYSSEQSKIFNTLRGGIAVTDNILYARRLKTYQDSSPFPDKKTTQIQLKNIIYNYYRFKHPLRIILANIARIHWGKELLISTTVEEEKGIQPNNYRRRMVAPIALIALNQLGKIDTYNSRRRKTAKKWELVCEKYDYKKPLVIKDSIPVFLRYPVLVDEDKKINSTWAKQLHNIDIGVWFVSQIHPNKSIYLSDCKNATIAVKQCVNFPCLK